MALLPIAAALLAAVQPSPNPAQSSDSADIVVIGERIRHIRVKTKRDRKSGLQRCIVKRSSGDPALDSRFCGAVLACAQTARKSAEMQACLDLRRNEMIKP